MEGKVHCVRMTVVCSGKIVASVMVKREPCCLEREDSTPQAHQEASPFLLEVH